MKNGGRLILVGIDAATLPMIDQLIAEGRLSTIAKLKRKGVAIETIPSTPVDTPTNWATIVTGTNVENHGVTSFTGHIAGEDFREGERKHMRNKSTEFLMAEPIWNRAEREGLRSLVLNYPIGWPSTLNDGIVVGGACPGADYWRIDQPTVYAQSSPEQSRLKVDTLNPKMGWEKIRILNSDKGGKSCASRLPPVTIGLPLKDESVFKLLVISEDGHDYDAVSYNDSKGQRKMIKEGEWTDWIKVEVNDDSSVFKLKLISLGGEVKDIQIYRTDIFQTSGWGYPSGIEKKINEAVGPYIEALECPHISLDPVRRPYGPINVNLETVLELVQMQADWFADSITFLQQEFSWDLLFSHFHFIDSLGHTFSAFLDKNSPWYSSRGAKEVWEIYAKAFEIIDSMIGRIIDKNADQNSIIGIISDHGTLPAWKMVDIPRLMEKRGYLHYEECSDTERLEIDLNSSEAVLYIDPQYIWVNLKGREKNGIVKESKYETIRNEIIQDLRETKDPENGKRIFSLVTRREDLGLSGSAENRIGDVVFFLNPRYSTWDGTIDSLRFGYKYPDQKKVVRSSQYVLGHHTPFLPSEKFGIFSNRAMLILKGPGIESGCEIMRSPELKDVTPTISKLLGINAPEDSEGNIIEEIIES